MSNIYPLIPRLLSGRYPVEVYRCNPEVGGVEIRIWSDRARTRLGMVAHKSDLGETYRFLLNFDRNHREPVLPEGGAA
jgi:hypothetical protein